MVGVLAKFCFSSLMVCVYGGGGGTNIGLPGAHPEGVVWVGARAP